MIAGTVIAELLPVVFGVGDAAKIDWGLIYVTLHFVALPVLGIILICVSAWTVVGGGRRNQRPALVPLLSALLVSAGYLVALALDQLPWSRSFVK